MRYDKVLLIRIEEADYKWLRAESKKQKLSIASLIRYYINFFKSKKQNEEQA